MIELERKRRIYKTIFITGNNNNNNNPVIECK